MIEKAPAEMEFEIGHVLFIDLVGYSKRLIDEQRELLNKLNTIVLKTEVVRTAEAAGKLTRIPTGDGMALVFRTLPEAPARCALEISKALREEPELQLRMGIHSGPVSDVTDVNERANVAGAGINMAQRVMDCGDAGHILLSRHVAEDLEHYARWQPCLHDLGECEVKHGARVHVVNLYTEDLGNPEMPEKFKQAAGAGKAAAAISGPTERPTARKWAMIGAALLMIAAVVSGLFIFLAKRSPTGAITSTAIPEKSIAVLPFENLSHDPDNAYFADGIQEEVLTRLAKIADLKVISRTSTQHFKSSPGNLPQIAKQLGVANILEGSVQKAADQVRVNVQLINAQTDSHVWAEKFDRKLTDIFAVESEIAAKIADILQAKLTGAEQRAISSRPTENSEAHQLYLRGRFYWNKWLGASMPAPEFDKSRQYYQQAIELDPNYALAYAGLADFYGFAFGFGLLPPEEKWAKAQEDNARKALELDPTLGEAYNPLASDKLYYHRDWPGAERNFRRGLELSPNFAEMHAHYAFCLVLFDRNEEALAEMRRALDLDPLSPRFGFSSARLFFFMRQYDAALDQYRKTLELDPSSAFAHEWLGDAYEKKQMQKEAIVEWSKALTLSGDGEHASLLERTYAASGFEPAVRALAQKKLQQLNGKTGRGEYVPALDYVIAYMRMGDKEQAFAWLAKAVAERNRLALEIKVNPIFDPLRTDLRFEALVQKIFANKQ
jgi:TolB-like protein/class 3 adenylate cyclase/Tfp pilus assembly protein PilF